MLRDEKIKLKKEKKYQVSLGHFLKLKLIS